MPSPFDLIAKRKDLSDRMNVAGGRADRNSIKEVIERGLPGFPLVTNPTEHRKNVEAQKRQIRKRHDSEIYKWKKDVRGRRKELAEDMREIEEDIRKNYRVDEFEKTGDPRLERAKSMAERKVRQQKRGRKRAFSRQIRAEEKQLKRQRRDEIRSIPQTLKKQYDMAA